MNLRASALLFALISAGGTCVVRARPPASHATLEPAPPNAQRATMHGYLEALRAARYAEAYALLDRAERSYYQNARNFGSIFAADAFRLTGFTIVGSRGNDSLGRVFFIRERARFRDHAHDVDLELSATVPIGVVRDGGAWRIKDPGHPWRAFPTAASASVEGVRVAVKKISYFSHRVEAVITFVNAGPRFVTILAYGKTVLHDDALHVFRTIESRDWTVTDKVLFEGLRLAPNAQYTGTLSFACDGIEPTRLPLSLTVAPLLIDGTDSPFEITVEQIAAAPQSR